jgi:hypothetical protein
VAVALGAAAFPRAGPAGRTAILGAVPVVGISRVYVGAHLPLDIAGGAALGLAVEAAGDPPAAVADGAREDRNRLLRGGTVASAASVIG